MIIKAHAKYLRVGPKKMRRLVNLIRNKGLMEAISILKLLNIANKRYILKLLESIKANAKIKNPDINLEEIKINRIAVNEGPRIKRMKPRARGRADVIKRRISHIEVAVYMPDVEKSKTRSRISTEPKKQGG